MDERQATQIVTDLYESAYGGLVRFAARSVGIAAAEDIVQETMMRLYRSLREGRDVENPKAWAICVVRREAGKLIQDQNTVRPAGHGLELVQPREALGGQAQEPSHGGDEVSQLLSVLTPREEEVIALRMSSMKYREIGTELGIGIKTVGTLLARALRKLQAAREAAQQTPNERQRHATAKRPKPLS